MISRKTPVTFLIFVLVGDLVGGVLAGLLQRFTSGETGGLHHLFVTSYVIGMVPPWTLDLHLITLTLGFTFKITLFSLIGILLGIYTYTQI